MPIQRTAHLAAFIINQVEVIARVNDVAQPEVQPRKIIYIVVLDGGRCQPLVVEIVEYAEVRYVVRKIGFPKGELRSEERRVGKECRL